MEWAMEIYRIRGVKHLEIANVADELYRFIKHGESQLTSIFVATRPIFEAGGITWVHDA